MSFRSTRIQSGRANLSSLPPRRLRRLALATLGAISVLGGTAAEAADNDELSRLKNENASLRAELEALRKVPGNKAAPTTATAPQVTDNTAPSSASAKPADGERTVGLDSVVVRTRARIERLQDVPLSVSVVTGRELEREGAVTIGDITKRTASVQYNTANSRQGSISIRGVGKQGQVDAQDPGVGVIVDGVSYAWGPLSFLDFIDVDSVEVARGPQGTLLGKNTSMGVIQVNSKKPSFTPEARYETTFGTYGKGEQSLIGKAVFGGAVVDDLIAWRGSFYVDKRRGPFGNEWNNGDQSWPDSNRAAGRLQLLITPSADFSARLIYDSLPRYPQNDNGLTFYTAVPANFANGKPIITTSSGGTTALTIAQEALNRNYFTNRAGSNWNGYNGSLVGSLNMDAQQPLFNGQQGYSGELNWQLENHTLTSITAYRSNYFDARNDEGSPFDITKNNNTDTQYRQLSQEFRLSSKAGEFVDYQVGAYFLDVQNDVHQKAEFGSDAGAYFANNAQYARLSASAPGSLLLSNSVNHLYTRQNDRIDNASQAIFGQANWKLSDQLKLTTGLRLTHEQRDFRGERVIINEGLGSDLGKFSTNATGTFSGGSGSAADAVAAQYFGLVNYGALNASQRQLVADAQRIRSRQLGSIYDVTNAKSVDSVHPNWVVSPVYKFNNEVTGYVSVSFGEKAAVTQVLSSGTPITTKKEQDLAYEVGLKTVLLNKTLVLNGALYQQDIKNFQQQGRVLDPGQTALNGTNTYANGLVNAEKVQLRGLEIDGVYGGIPNLAVRFGGAYNLATYKRFDFSALPVEDNFAGAPAYKSLEGKQLSGAPRLLLNLGAEYRKPLSFLPGHEFHSSFTTYFASRQNLDASLSKYAWQESYTLTDLAIGIGRQDRSFDVTFLVKNLFDTTYNTGQSWNSYTPGTPRFYGLVLSGKL